MEIKLPENVEKIINTLEAKGYEAYAVGGCIRDSILKRSPNDWDVTTSALPGEIKEAFKKTFDTGIKHGTVSVLLGGEIFEVTTFRIDGEYEDSRHPKEVTFTASLTEDLLRRDFTINAMAYNPKTGLVDPYGGYQDIEKKVIRCVGKAYDRFSEDALRILRALRFAAQLDYSIDDETQAAIKALSHRLKNISAERIQAELIKILLSPNPEILRDAYKLGVTGVFLPEFDRLMETKQNNPHHLYTVGEHTLRVVKGVREDKSLRLAALLHDIGKPDCKTTGEDGIDHFYGHDLAGEKISRNILRRLKMDNETTGRVCALVKNHDRNLGESKKSVRRTLNRVGEEYFPDLFELHEADISAQSSYKREEKMANLNRARMFYEEILKNGECVSLKNLAVTGKDLIEMGISPGPGIGEILKRLLEIVLEDPSKNTKEELKKLV